MPRIAELKRRHNIDRRFIESTLYASPYRHLECQMSPTRCDTKTTFTAFSTLPIASSTLLPEDVARTIAALCHPATYWLTGNVLQVDGGENIVG